MTLAQKQSFVKNALIMASGDVAANVFIVKAFSTTSAVSAMFIQSLSVVFVMMISPFVIGARYNRINLLGALIASGGLVMVMFGKHANGENKSIEGDLYALGAALGYAVSNVLQEKLSRLEKGYPALTLTAMGVFGSVFSSVFLFCTPMGRRALVLVRKMASSPFKPGNLGLAVYPFLMLALYSLIPCYFQLFSHDGSSTHDCLYFFAKGG